MRTGRDGDTLLGYVALEERAREAGGIKSMRTPASLRGCGAARPILGHILEIARARGRRDLLLDTGKHSAFEPAQRLCRSVGFASSGPFPDNVENGRSTFMHLTLADMSPRWAG